jgi:pSer/pThr/pTyr-binding forkhead associated (FHA) protein
VTVQLKLLSGKNSGAIHLLESFPAVIGRQAGSHLRLTQPGVWDRHLQIQLVPQEGFTLTVLPGSWALVNGHKLDRAVLRNGDVIEIGSVKLQFWLSPTRQQSMRLRETMTWISLGLLCAGQIALIYHLLP